MKKQLFLLFMLLSITASGCGTEQTETTTNGNKEVEIEADDKQIDTETITREEVVENSTSKSNVGTDEETGSKAMANQGSLPDLKVHYIDVGQADATLLEFDSYTILIDAGDWNSNNVVNYLKTKNISEVDIAIGTHPDADHIGQLDKVINQFDVGEVWLSGNSSTSETFEKVMEAVDSSGADYDEPRAGDLYEVGSLQIDILHPTHITGNPNEESISLKLTYGAIGFVFTGDAETNQEQEMMNLEVNLDAEFLQLGHHGSNTSTSKAFLDAVSPKVAVYSAGAGNHYGHPASEVVELVQDYGATLYGTDVHGTIVVTTDGVEYAIATKQDGTITPSAESSSGKLEESNKDDKDEPEENTSSQCVNINEASVEEVQAIIHIGPARAENLVDLRPYNSVADLSSIKGIGPSRIDDIKAEGIACIGG
ncbi:MBL fold metallo-hydrolase [Aquibacillus rhizosphaerae]|uniref:MBL fold metallo-hydrolase n=1 Tax=Aquibacillus rhizosphaerae TaxID=3051431 RepID=A0ABT7LB39_9BACI|nr:MBL fold metallo-hydrolase [Aquibacillus sp. LR5S19]MDL4843078.1 MBL fold metallo-hydrolase [Aquibacillus sp. LR5S19]